MIRMSFAALIALYSAAAFSYGEGRYVCKNNHPNLPDNIYVIKNVPIGVSSDKLPYIEADRFSFKSFGDPNSGVVKSSVKGFATVFTSEVLPDTLALGALRLEFVNDEMVGCIK